MGQADKDDIIRLIEEDEDDSEIPQFMPLLPVVEPRIRAPYVRAR